jgi:hypothetical protein
MSSAKDVWELSRAVLGDEDGIIAVLRIYMDESGTHYGSPVVTVGAYCARPKTWQEFTADWNKKKRPIKVFHAVDCQNLKNEFEGWDESERDEYVKKLLPVIPRHKMPGIGIGIVMTDFNDAFQGKEDLRVLLGNPYTACFQWVTEIIVRRAYANDYRGTLAFLHEDNDFKEDAMQSFDYVKKKYGFSEIDMTLSFGHLELPSG